jgi:Domain of unknown function (DUF1707)
MMLPDSREPGQAPMLASNAERDAVAQRLQVAFAEHRLNDDEFDQRIRAALTARSTSELDQLTADLPASTPAPAAAAAGRKPGRFAVAMKSSISRVGRWTVPARFYSVVYKGSGLLDLRAAELTAAVTTIVAVSYKSRTEILLPPGVRIELGGTGVSMVSDEAGSPGGLLAADAPVVHIRGMAYKGTIEARTRPA